MPEVVQPPTSREERLAKVVARGKRLRIFRGLRWAAAATATVAVVAIAGGSALLSRPDHTETAGPVTTESSLTPSPTTPLTPEATPQLPHSSPSPDALATYAHCSELYARHEALAFPSPVPDVMDLEDIPWHLTTHDTPDTDFAFQEKTDVYAGMFLSAGYLWIGFTRNAELHLAEARATSSEPERLRAFSARLTLQELSDLQMQIDFEEFAHDEIEISGTGIAENFGRVTVWLARLDPSWIQTLVQRFGSERLCFSEGVAQPV